MNRDKKRPGHEVFYDFLNNNRKLLFLLRKQLFLIYNYN